MLLGFSYLGTSLTVINFKNALYLYPPSVRKDRIDCHEHDRHIVLSCMLSIGSLLLSVSSITHDPTSPFPNNLTKTVVHSLLVLYFGIINIHGFLDSCFRCPYQYSRHRGTLLRASILFFPWERAQNNLFLRLVSPDTQQFENAS